ncbi:uncharacterized protein [Chironomus tepperi]|uniref:uncharacterized protein n=1 Tax=Chironomus tepperi TaxID=113505 RepID=UPI00391FB107
MTKIIFSSLIFSLIVSTECRMIYRRYEKENHEKNFVEIVEIFETKLQPPNFIENEKELNDFLGKDAFKTDMNCTEKEETTKRISEPTTTKPLKSPTSTERVTTPFPTITFRPPNLDNIFTVKPPTRPTIRPNPKENENPDYTELYNWPKNQPKPNVQVTKHLPTTIKPPLIVIQETDVQVPRNRTNPINTSEKNPETSIETVIDNEIYEYNEDNGTENGNDVDDDYDENAYDLANENDQNQLADDESYSEENEDGETNKRRKRLNKIQRRRKHIQSTKSLISKKL